MSTSLTKSWSDLVSANDQEQVPNGKPRAQKPATKDTKASLKRLPSKTLNNTYVEPKKAKDEEGLLWLAVPSLFFSFSFFFFGFLLTRDISFGFRPMSR
jgi:hypothetical protein